MNKLYYLDNAATTRIYPEVADLIDEESKNDFFNPSALYKPSVALSVKIKMREKASKRRCMQVTENCISHPAEAKATTPRFFARENQRAVA